MKAFRGRGAVLTVLWAWGVVGRLVGQAREAHPKIAWHGEVVGKVLAEVPEENFPSK